MNEFEKRIMMKEIFNRTTAALKIASRINGDENTKWKLMGFEAHHQRHIHIMDVMFHNEDESDARILIMVIKINFTSPIKDKMVYRVNFFNRQMFTDFFVKNNLEYGNIPEAETMEFLIKMFPENA